MTTGYTTVEPQPSHKLNNGLQMPTVGLGTWKSEPGKVEESVQIALKAGYRHIDCAPVYGNEKEVGRAFSAIFSEGKVSRKDVWITSKLPNTHHAAADVHKAIRTTLSDLQLEYLDLYLVHWPVTGKQAPKLDPPIKETWAEMEKLVDQGLVKTIGISNFSVVKTKDVQGFARIQPAVNQVEIHPYWRNQKLWEFAQSGSIHLTAYSPLGSPDSAEAMKRGADVPDVLQNEVVLELAKKLGKEPGQILIRYAIQHGTSVLPKSVTPSRIVGNLDVLKWEIPEADYKRLNSLDFQMRMLNGASVASFNPTGPYKNAHELWDGEVSEENIKRIES